MREIDTKIFLGLLWIQGMISVGTGKRHKTAYQVMQKLDTLPDPEDCKNAVEGSCVRVQVRAELIRNKDNIKILDTGAVLERNVPNEPATRPGFIRSSFHCPMGTSASFILSAKSDPCLQVSGTFHAPGGRFFILKNCGCNCQYLFEESVQDWDKPDAVIDLESNRDKPYSILRNSGNREGQDDDEIVTFSIMVYYTQTFLALENYVIENVYDYIATIMSELNQGYQNSNIPLRGELLCQKEIDLHDSGKGSHVITAFRKMFSSVDELLNTADVAFVLTGNDIDVCGIAYKDTTSYPIGLGTHKCALGGLTFGHEIAHIFGCNHNRNPRKSISAYPGTNYGYLISPPGNVPTSGFRTIMSYRYPNHYTRLNYFSSPDMKIGSHLTLGDHMTDNRMIMIKNRYRQAEVGNEANREKCPTFLKCPNLWSEDICEDHRRDEMCHDYEIRKNCQRSCKVCECEDAYEYHDCSYYSSMDMCDHPTVELGCAKTCHSCHSSETTELQLNTTPSQSSTSETGCKLPGCFGGCLDHNKVEKEQANFGESYPLWSVKCNGACGSLTAEINTSNGDFDVRIYSADSKSIKCQSSCFNCPEEDCSATEVAEDEVIIALVAYVDGYNGGSLTSVKGDSFHCVQEMMDV